MKGWQKYGYKNPNPFSCSKFFPIFCQSHFSLHPKEEFTNFAGLLKPV